MTTVCLAPLGPCVVAGIGRGAAPRLRAVAVCSGDGPSMKRGEMVDVDL